MVYLGQLSGRDFRSSSFISVSILPPPRRITEANSSRWVRAMLIPSTITSIILYEVSFQRNLQLTRTAGPLGVLTSLDTTVSRSETFRASITTSDSPEYCPKRLA